MNPISVLLLNSSPVSLRSMVYFMQQYDDVVVIGTASDNKEGLAKAQSLRPQVVVIDLGTPGLINLKAISHLRTVMPDASIIATSLLDVTGYREAALAAGADDFLRKMALVTDLLPAIRRVANRRGGQTLHPDR